MSAAPRYGQRIEHAIVRLLIDELAKVGFVPVGIHHEDLPRGECELVARSKIFAEVFEYDGPITLHFAPTSAIDASTDAVDMEQLVGVLLVNGNGQDIISDWHTRPKEFDHAVGRVASAAHEGPLTLSANPLESAALALVPRLVAVIDDIMKSTRGNLVVQNYRELNDSLCDARALIAKVPS